MTKDLIYLAIPALIGALALGGIWLYETVTGKD